MKMYAVLKGVLAELQREREAPVAEHQGRSCSTDGRQCIEFATPSRTKYTWPAPRMTPTTTSPAAPKSSVDTTTKGNLHSWPRLAG